MKADESILKTQPGASKKQRVKSPVSIKAAIVSLFLLTFLTYFIQYAEFTQLIPSIDNMVAPSIMGILIIMCLFLFNSLMKKLGKNSWCFTAQEVVTIYIFIGFGGFVASLGLVGTGVGIISGLSIRALEMPQHYGPVLDQFSSLVIITDEMVSMDFWFGGADKVPWEYWIGPIIFWTVFWVVMFWVILCCLTLVRKHWNEREKLTYPLTIPIMDLVSSIDVAEDAKHSNPFWKNQIFLMGLIYPVFNGLLNIIHRFVPQIPTIPYALQLSQYFTEPPFHVLGEWKPLEFVFNSPVAIGIGYLVSTQITFSIWFFHLALGYLPRVLLYMNHGTIMIGNARPDWELGRGILVGVTLTCLWLARSNIKVIVSRAIGKEKATHYDEDEPLSYPVVFWGGLFGLAFIFITSTLILKINIVAFAAFYLIFLGVAISFARLRAEAGYTVNMANVSYLYEGVCNSLPAKFLGTSTRASLGIHFNVIGSGGAFSGIPGLTSEAIKFSEQAGISSKSMVRWLIAILIFVFLLGFVFLLPIAYNNGLLNMDNYRQYHSRVTWAHIPVENLNHRDPQSLSITFLSGIVLAILMQIARINYVWWPFNTLAAGIASDQWAVFVAGPFFIAWVIKSVIMRYGGYQMAEKIKPFFIALIIGGTVMSGLNSLVGIIERLVT